MLYLAGTEQHVAWTTTLAIKFSATQLGSRLRRIQHNFTPYQVLAKCQWRATPRMQLCVTP